MRDVGRLGESCFRQWCASAGLAANKSDVDTTGWDFLVEFDFSKEVKDIPSAIHEAAFECKVQVKSTDRQARKDAITLANWRRLITAPIPAFFVFIEFDDKETPQRVFVKHVDLALSTKALKRIHEEEASGAGNRLHKKTMTVTYGNVDMLPETSGAALATALRGHIGYSMAEYGARKNAHLEQAGFEDGFATVSITIEGEENIARFINATMGMDAGELDVIDFQATQKRFGKTARQPYIEEPTGKIEFTRIEPDRQGALTARTDNLGGGFSFPVDFFNSMTGTRKCRFKGNFFEVLYLPESGEFQFSVNFGAQEFRLAALRIALKFMELLCSKTKIYFEFITNDNKKLEFSATSPGYDFYFEEEMAAADTALRLLNHLNIFDEVSVSLPDLSQHALSIVQFEKFIDDSNRAMRLEMEAFDPPLPTGKELACLNMGHAKIGPVRIYAFVTLIGKPLPSDSGGLTLFPSQKILERVVIRGPNRKVESSALIKLVNEISEKYDEDFNCVIFFDKNNL